eukprot:247398-Prymnesium_polylepis.1
MEAERARRELFGAVRPLFLLPCHEVRANEETALSSRRASRESGRHSRAAQRRRGRRGRSRDRKTEGCII